jgi:hypothetical protein
MDMILENIFFSPHLDWIYDSSIRMRISMPATEPKVSWVEISKKKRGLIKSVHDKRQHLDSTTAADTVASV